MGLLSDTDLSEVRERLRGMTDPVKLIHFTQELNLEYGREARTLIQEIASASEKISAEFFNVLLDKSRSAEYGITKVPATVVAGAKAAGIRFFGLPAGYEFSALLDAILAVSNSDSGLTAESKLKLSLIAEPVHLEVLVTPTCPHCPGMARLAHGMALQNELITADCVEITEFPELAAQYSVHSVPKTMINGGAAIDGALPEDMFVDALLIHLGIAADERAPESPE